MNGVRGSIVKKLGLALAGACLVIVAIAATRAVVSDPGGAVSAGPVPSAPIRAGAGETDSTGNGSVITAGVPEVDYTIDLDTGVMTPLPRAIIRSVVEPGPPTNWVPRYAASLDGSLLAYVGIGDEGSVQIFTARIDGTGVRQVTHDPRGATSPAWSPDGTRIVYAGYGSGDVRNLFVLDVATGESRQVTDGTHDVWQPQFAPDGSSLLYTGGTDQKPLLMTVPVAGGESTLLITPEADRPDSANGSISPDGSLVTFLGSGLRCGPCRWLANADGTDRRVIAGCFASNPAGAWSRDGSRIVCSGDATHIVVVDIATGDASPVARGRVAIWLDRHTLLVEVP